MGAPEVVHRPEEQRFEIEVEEGIALAAYTRAGDQLVLTHTEVPWSHQGEGLATALAEAAFAYARRHGLKVVPRCAFMAQFARTHPEYDDLVPQLSRRG